MVSISASQPQSTDPPALFKKDLCCPFKPFALSLAQFSVIGLQAWALGAGAVLHFAAPELPFRNNKDLATTAAAAAAAAALQTTNV